MRWFWISFLCLVSASLNTSATSNTSFNPQKLPNTSDFEKEVVEEINSTRINPTSLIPDLEKREMLFRGLIMYPPKQKPFLTVEGFPAVDEAVKFLRKTPKVQSLKLSEGLVKVAKAQLSDLMENPRLGHFGKDGSDLSKRLDKIGKAGKAAENITHTPLTPKEVVINMIVDDGVKSRHHRQNVMNPQFRLIGVACSKKKNLRYVCVIVFAEKFEVGDPSKRLRKY